MAGGPDEPGQQRRSRVWVAVVSAVVVIGLAAASWVTGWPFWTSDPVEVVGGGPPPADLPPPPGAEATSSVVQAEIPTTDVVCANLTVGRVGTVLGTEATGSAPCSYSATSGQSVTVEVLDGPFQDVFVAQAEGWPQVPQVVTDPWQGLFFIDAEHSALLIDGGEQVLVVQLTDITRDRTGHLDALTALAKAALG